MVLIKQWQIILILIGSFASAIGVLVSSYDSLNKIKRWWPQSLVYLGTGAVIIGTFVVSYQSNIQSDNIQVTVLEINKKTSVFKNKLDSASNSLDELINATETSKNNLKEEIQKSSNEIQKSTSDIQNATNDIKKKIFKQSEISTYQLEILTKKRDLDLEVNKIEFDKSGETLTDLFPNQDFNNYSSQENNYLKIKEVILDVMKNPYSFILQDFQQLGYRLLLDCDDCRYHFHNRALGKIIAFCNGKQLSDSDLDKCKYENFRKNYINFMNLFNTVHELNQVKKSEKKFN